MPGYTTMSGSDRLPERDGRFATTILLVEDEGLIRTLIADYLRDEGFDVLEAFDSPEAKRLLATNAAAIDLVIADVRMPGESGAQLAKFIHRSYPAIPVLLASGNATPDEVHGEQFITKPFSFSRLSTAISEMLTTRQSD